MVPDAPVTQAVPLTLAGSPVTTGIVMLNATGFVSLKDADGALALMVRADQPFQWPQYFGVVAKANAVHPANFDLSVVYDPPDGAKGLSTPAVLEKFEDLSFTTTDTNFAATQINLLSKLITVPSTYVPPTAPPAGFPTGPTMLSNTTAVDLDDVSAVPFFTVQATNPATWPQLFGILTQGNATSTSSFNLVIVYAPSSGGVGVNVPVTVALFKETSLQTVAADFTSPAELIAVVSFDDTPNPGLSAAELMSFDPGEAVPVISLTSSLNTIKTSWHADQDLLEEDESGLAFVVEVESDGKATLRFGDDVNGKRPDVATAFTAKYRIGNGTAGNVGAETLINFAGDPRVQSCTNPLAASGGTDPETNDQIRRRAPQAFMRQERAVTMNDYEVVAEMNPLVEQAVSTLRWTGSWYTVFLAAEPHGGGNLTPTLKKAIKKNVERYHLAGQDLEIRSPQYVSIEIELEICVDSDYFRADVQEALEDVLSDRVLPGGQKGLFFSDNFVFGQTVYLSPVYAACRKVPGVKNVTATVFQPQGVNSQTYLHMGEIKIGAFQVARLENDRNFPDHGRLTLVMEGGK
ncbi:MAG TPA: putative baseplate assembly protein, partial [Candidatus Angelobacter sp.]|nr:putative baseplate assembly protein [Candidatus Angelobacter sp.]